VRPLTVPNVPIALIDDAGFGSSAPGGPCNTPTAERLAKGDWAHPLPHDRALLTDAPGPAHGPEPPFGRDGAITEMATPAPGNNSIRPRDGPLAETLRPTAIPPRLVRREAPVGR
jgi:arylsulfatase